MTSVERRSNERGCVHLRLLQDWHDPSQAIRRMSKKVRRQGTGRSGVANYSGN